MRISDIPSSAYTIWGRTIPELSPLTLFWSGSGIEIAVKCSEMYMSFRTDYSSCEQWIAVLVNGAFISRQMLPKGECRVCLFRGMNPDKVKTVQVIKEVQAMGDDQAAILQIIDIEHDGEFAVLKPHKYNIEVIGDSISSGEGSIGAKQEEDWIPMFFSAVYEYGMVTGRNLDARVNIVSQSGWGLTSGWDNDNRHIIPPHYRNVCSVLNGQMNGSLGVKKEYDFAGGVDAVIINLGTNDCGALDQPEFVNPETGERFKQQRNDDGTLSDATRNRIENGVISFLEEVRECNPGAYIVWVLGMLGNYLNPYVENALDNYKKKSGDTRVAFLALEDTNDKNVGARSHPGKLCHEQAAERITSFLEGVL